MAENVKVKKPEPLKCTNGGDARMIFKSYRDKINELIEYTAQLEDKLNFLAGDKSAGKYGKQV